MGHLWLRKLTHCIKQGYFEHIKALKSIGFSRYQIYFSVESLYGATRKDFFRAKFSNKFLTIHAQQI